jgi:hypothetical protein
MVGPLRRLRKEFTLLIEAMLDGSEPSQCRFILGPNGNGKTLLNNMIMAYATRRNREFDDDGHIKARSFTVLFARTTLNERAPEQVGIEFAQMLTRSLDEPPHLTYSSMAAKIVSDFEQSKSPPLLARVLPVFKYSLKRIAGDYDQLFDIFTETEREAITSQADRAFGAVQKAIAKRSSRKAFEQYAEKHKINDFLKRHYLNQRQPLSIAKLNKSLLDDLTTKTGVANPLETVRAIISIARDVGTKLLILIIDDFNLEEPPRVLLPLFDRLNEFKQPKLLLVVSGVAAIWDTYAERMPLDRSFMQKLGLFGNRRNVLPPTEDDVRNLADSLIGLINDEEEDDGREINITTGKQRELCRMCPRDSFRAAMKYLIDNLEEEIVQRNESGIRGKTRGSAVNG